MTWYAHVTVATVVVDQDRFLMVYEKIHAGTAYNQPAGHLEENETLEAAALRETLEETGWHVELTGVLGIHLYKAPGNGVTYVRITYVAKPTMQAALAPPDTDIIEAMWLTYPEIKARQSQLRSPMVLSDIERFRDGQIKPLDLVINIQVQ